MTIFIMKSVYSGKFIICLRSSGIYRLTEDALSLFWNIYYGYQVLL